MMAHSVQLLAVVHTRTDTDSAFCQMVVYANGPLEERAQ